jgi:endonuclease/exonuclease/phosphatase family metal-dependent hydrolase
MRPYHLTRKVYFILTIILHTLYFLVVFVPFLQSGNFWPVSILGFFFPFLLILVVLFILINLLLKKWKPALISLFILLAGWRQITAAIPFRLSNKFTVEQQQDAIRILSWNVSRWDERNKEKRGGVSFRPLMMDFIQQQNADVLCLQEFFECLDPTYFEANIPAVKKLGYPYYYFFPSTKFFDGNFQYGLCIFSKFPITDSASFINLKGEHSEGLCFADIVVNKKTIRVFNTHLESPGLGAADFDESQQVRVSESVLSKISNSYYSRNLQAAFIAGQIRASPYPAILCSNTDDVPNSYAYFTLKGNLQDAFLKRGAGFGRTYRFISPTLRTDHVFADKRLETIQYNCEKIPYSDHYPIVADFRFQ